MNQNINIFLVRTLFIRLPMKRKLILTFVLFLLWNSSKQKFAALRRGWDLRVDEGWTVGERARVFAGISNCAAISANIVNSLERAFVALFVLFYCRIPKRLRLIRPNVAKANTITFEINTYCLWWKYNNMPNIYLIRIVVEMIKIINKNCELTELRVLLKIALILRWIWSKNNRFFFFTEGE